MTLDSLQIGRALAAQYVLLFHVPTIMAYRLPVTLDNAFLKAGHSGVYFFFVLSGFIMFVVHWRDIGQPSRLGTFALKRVLRIYPLFWFVMAVMVAGQLAATGLEPELRDPVSVLRALLLVPFDGFPPLIVAWTLSHELLFYLLLGAAILFGRFGLWVMVAWWVGCIVALFLALRGTPMAFPADFAFAPLNLLFAMGMFAAALYRHLSVRIAWIALVSGCANFVAMIAVDIDSIGILSSVIFGLCSTAIVLGAASLETQLHPRLPRWLVFMGDASYSTYLAHVTAIVFGSMVLSRLAPGIGAWSAFFLLATLATLAGIFCHLIVERPLQARLKRLSLPRAPMRKA